MFLFSLFLISIVHVNVSSALSVPSTNSQSVRSLLPLHAKTTTSEELPLSESTSRRNALKQTGITFFGTIAALTTNQEASVAVDDDLTRGGVPLTPFNSLNFQYRNGNVVGGLDASTLNEPSVPYMEFLDRLNKDEVVFVEFMAPDGDAAYATFKSTGEEEVQPIRIGEGYPIEDHEGWSSPAFVIKAVKKKNVPYKFTVPGLSKYNK